MLEAPRGAPATSDIDPFSDAYLGDPYPFHQQLRDAGPVVWLAQWQVFAVARAAPVKAVLGDWETFCSGAGVGLANFKVETPWRTPSLLLETDPPDHTRNRAVIGRALSPASLRGLKSSFESAAEELVAALPDGADFDAVPLLAEAFPLKVFADAVGVPAEGRRHLLAYGNMVFNAMGPRNERFERAMAHAAQVVPWIERACQRDVLTPSGLGAQIYAAADEGAVSAREAALIVRSFLSAGVDTTAAGIANALYCFARNPDQWARVRADPALARAAFEEVLRFESPFQAFFRTTTREVELEGTVLPAEAKVLVLIGAANRDPRQWEDPDRFDVKRKTLGHVGFGFGIHGCVGQMIARMEVEAVLAALARRFERIALAGPPTALIHNTLRSFVRLPLRLGS
ncbi:cytochrome P450 [Xanthobacter sp. KR7-225]|uniref:cytochrome P450 n=1 Tax=Xanthobacter sp. KR7-225 TaxID=3156613 RepID=UPI0032B3E4CA